MEEKYAEHKISDNLLDRHLEVANIIPYRDLYQFLLIEEIEPYEEIDALVEASLKVADIINEHKEIGYYFGDEFYDNLKHNLAGDMIKGEIVKDAHCMYFYKN